MAFYGFDIIELLHNAGVGSKIGPTPTLYLNDTPATVDSLVAVFTYGGEPSEHIHNIAAGPAYENPRFQLYSRSKSAQTALNKIEAARFWLNRVRNETVNGTHYLSIVEIAPPQQMPKDESQRFIYVQNFAIRKAYVVSNA
jgi:hypothetical protein